MVGFEATGNYRRTLAHRLLHNGWDKNAPKDAQVILHMLRIGVTQRYVDPLTAGINDHQELSKTHETISRMKTQTLHRIRTHYLALYFPEIARLAGNSLPGWFLALIERFPTPASIMVLEREAFSAAAWPLMATAWPATSTATSTLSGARRRSLGGKVAAVGRAAKAGTVSPRTSALSPAKSPATDDHTPTPSR